MCIGSSPSVTLIMKSSCRSRTLPFLVNLVLLSLHEFDYIRRLSTLYVIYARSCQRWNPVDGFSERLLPSDRWQWSDVTGLQHRPLDSFQLPSSSWEWEGDWYVDENFEGEPTEKEVSYHFLLLFSILDLHSHSCLQGWSYAVDFPATYYKDKKWNSCVRRRRWIRYRRYKAMDIWAKVCGIQVCTLCVLSVPPIHPCFSPSVSQQIPSQHVTLPDPFSDISCGGWEISEEPRGQLSLWAVSLQGKVYVHRHTSTVYIQPVHHRTFVCFFLFFVC